MVSDPMRAWCYFVIAVQYHDHEHGLLWGAPIPKQMYVIKPRIVFLSQRNTEWFESSRSVYANSLLGT